MNIKLETYYTGNNGKRPANAVAVAIGDNLTLYFSYDTCIGFHAPGCGNIARVNSWGPTTGKHINAVVSDKSKRLSDEQFNIAVTEAVSKALGGAA